MIAARKKKRKVERSPYPHIVKVSTICGGDATIEGTRIAVWHIIGYHYKVGMAVEEILRDFPQLTPSQVFSALAYYHDNQKEVDRAAYENSYEAWKEQHGESAASKPAAVSG